MGVIFVLVTSAKIIRKNPGKKSKIKYGKLKQRFSKLKLVFSIPDELSYITESLNTGNILQSLIDVISVIKSKQHLW